jgi:Holliday junction resolvase
MSARSRNKGKVGEREVAQLLRDHGFDARRGVQFQGGPDSPDVIGLPGVHVEVKRTESFRLYPALEQAKTERKDGDIPAVFHRANSRPWVVVLPAEDFLGLVRSSTSARPALYGSPRLKEVIVEAAMAGVFTEREAQDIFEEYGLRNA